MAPKSKKKSAPKAPAKTSSKNSSTEKRGSSLKTNGDPIQESEEDWFWNDIFSEPAMDNAEENAAKKQVSWLGEEKSNKQSKPLASLILKEAAASSHGKTIKLKLDKSCPSNQELPSPLKYGDFINSRKRSIQKETQPSSSADDDSHISKKKHIKDEIEKPAPDVTSIESKEESREKLKSLTSGAVLPQSAISRPQLTQYQPKPRKSVHFENQDVVSNQPVANTKLSGKPVAVHESQEHNELKKTSTGKTGTNQKGNVVESARGSGSFTAHEDNSTMTDSIPRDTRLESKMLPPKRRLNQNEVEPSPRLIKIIKQEIVPNQSTANEKPSEKTAITVQKSQEHQESKKTSIARTRINLDGNPEQAARTLGSSTVYKDNSTMTDDIPRDPRLEMLPPKKRFQLQYMPFVNPNISTTPVAPLKEEEDDEDDVMIIEAPVKKDSPDFIELDDSDEEDLDEEGSKVYDIKSPIKKRKDFQKEVRWYKCEKVCMPIFVEYWKKGWFDKEFYKFGMRKIVNDATLYNWDDSKIESETIEIIERYTAPNKSIKNIQLLNS